MSKQRFTHTMGKVLAGMMAAALLFTGASTDVNAETTGSVAVNSAIVRQDASTGADSVCTVSSGSEVKISEQKTDSSGNVWYHVTLSDGATGYIRSDLLKVNEPLETESTETEAETTAETTESTAESGNVVNGIDVSAITLPDGIAAQDYQQATVNVSAGKIRSDASTDSEIVATLGSGDNLVIGGSKQGSDSKTWYYVAFVDGGSQKNGYIRSDLISMGEVIVIEAPVQEETVAEETPAEEAPAVNNDYELVFTDDGTGTNVWYLYNHIDNTREKLQELLDFADAQTEKQAANAATIKKMKVVIIILAVLLVIAIVALVFFIIRGRSGGYYDYDDDDEEDEEDDDDEEDEEITRRRRRFGRKKYDDEDEDEDEYDEEEEEPEPRRRRTVSETPARRRVDPEPEPVRRRTTSDSAPKRPVRYEEETPVRPATRKPATKSKNFMLDDDFEFEFLKLDDED